MCLNCRGGETCIVVVDCRLDGTGVKEGDLKLKLIKYYHRLFTKTLPFLFSVLDQDVSCISMKRHFHGKLFFLVPMVMCSLLDFHGVHPFHTKRFCLLDNYWSVLHIIFTPLFFVSVRCFSSSCQLSLKFFFTCYSLAAYNIMQFKVYHINFILISFFTVGFLVFNCFCAL
jgi:hypothetical protein